MSNEDDMLTVKQAAAHTGKSAEALYQARRRGRLRSHIIDGRIYFRRGDLDAYVKRARPGKPPKVYPLKE